MSVEVTGHSELGAALRTWRGRVSPAAAGIADEGYRRVPGLRRHEVASLACVSVDYLMRLEQGRATRPSAQVLDALAVVLRLSASERNALYKLAGSSPRRRGDVPTAIPDRANRLLERLPDTPLAICTQAWDVVKCNVMWAALIGDSQKWQGRERNLAWRHFVGLEPRFQVDDDSRSYVEHELIIGLRNAQVTYPDDQTLAHLISTLCGVSSSFEEGWKRFEVAPRVHHQKTILHPRVGAVTVDSDVVSITGSDLLMIALTCEPMSDAARRLSVLRAGGTIGDGNGAAELRWHDDADGQADPVHAGSCMRS